MSKLSDYFADYVPSLYIEYVCGEQEEDGIIKDLGLIFPSDTLIEIFENIQKDNIGIEWNNAVGLTIKEALQNKFGADIEHIYICDEDTGDIFIDEDLE